MRDALNDAPRTGAIAAWDRFFFTPSDPAPLGLIRIATGLLLLWSLGCLGMDLHAFLGSQGWVDQEILHSVREHEQRLEWSLWDAVPDRMLRPAWVGAMLILGMYTVGLGSRVTAPLAWAIAVSTTRRNPIILFGFDQIVTMWVFYPAITGSSGRAFSLDRWIALRRGKPDPATPTVGSNIALRLIQINLAIVYGAAGLAKVGGRSWWDGSAIIKTLGNGEFRPFNLTWILGVPGGESFLNLATHLGLWTELLYPVLIWKPAFRRYVLVAVVLMHAGIAITMGLTEFSLAMLAGNLAFVTVGRGRKTSIDVESSEGSSLPSASPSPSRRPRR